MSLYVLESSRLRSSASNKIISKVFPKLRQQFKEKKVNEAGFMEYRLIYFRNKLRSQSSFLF